jgi:hypothetical protein
MSIELPQRHGEHEAGRMAVQGRRTDDGSDNTLIVVHENNGAWACHGLGASGVKISKTDAVTWARGILSATKTTL